MVIKVCEAKSKKGKKINVGTTKFKQWSREAKKRAASTMDSLDNKRMEKVKT